MTEKLNTDQKIDLVRVAFSTSRQDNAIDVYHKMVEAIENPKPRGCPYAEGDK